MAANEDEFRKEIHLPIALKQDLEVMAIRQGHRDMKTMIERKTIAELAKYKENNQD